MPTIAWLNDRAFPIPGSSKLASDIEGLYRDSFDSRDNDPGFDSSRLRGASHVLVPGMRQSIHRVLTNLLEPDTSPSDLPVFAFVEPQEGPPNWPDSSQVYPGSVTDIRELIQRIRDGQWQACCLPALEISNSILNRTLYGFTLGAGLVYSVSEMQHRADRRPRFSRFSTLRRFAEDIVSQGIRRLESRPARVSVNGEPGSERSLAGLMVGTLERGMWNVRLGSLGTPTVIEDSSARQFIAKAVKNTVAGGFFSAAQQRAFRTFALDWSGSYVVDDVLYPAGKPHVLRVREGPDVRVMAD